MSLKLLQTADPAFVYAPGTFNAGYIDGFYYDAKTDLYKVVILVDNQFNGTFTRFQFDPVTGLQSGSPKNINGLFLGIFYTNNIFNSDWNKIYAVRNVDGNPDNSIVEVSADIPVPTVFQIDNPIVKPSDIGGHTNVSQFALNREKKIIVFGVDTEPNLFFYNYGTGQKLGTYRTPGSMLFGNIISESNTIAWVAMHSTEGIDLIKLNFITRKTELFTNIPNLGVSTNLFIAYDSIRQNIAVYQSRPDNPITGAATHRIDIYKPLIDSSSLILTDPVPVTALKPNSSITFVAHLGDNKGTGGANKTVKMSNLNTNASIRQSMTKARIDGSVVIPYNSPNILENDTISLQVTI